MPFRVLQRLSIRSQLLLAGALLGLLGLGVVVMALREESRQSALVATADAETSAQQVADELDSRMRDHLRMLAQLTLRPRVRAMDPAACDTFAHDLPALLPELVSIGVRRLDGSLVCSSLAGAQPVLAPMDADPLRQAASRGQPYVGVARLGERTGRWVVIVAQPLRNDAGEVVGAVLGPLDLLRYSQRIFERLPGSVLVSVHDGQHRVLLRSHNAAEFVGRIMQGEMQAVADPGHAHGGGVDIMGVPNLARMAPMQHGNWLVIAGVRGEALQAPASQRLLLAGGQALAMAALLAGAAALGQWLSSPLRRLGACMDRALQDPSVRATPGGSRDATALATRLNRLLEHMGALAQQREALQQHADALVQNTGEAVLLLDADLRILDASTPARRPRRCTAWTARPCRPWRWGSCAMPRNPGRRPGRRWRPGAIPPCSSTATGAPTARRCRWR